MNYPSRSTLIKLVQTGRNRLGLDDDTYRAMLENITGLRSCGDKKMTPQKLVAVLARMRELGFEAAPQKAKGKAGGRPPLASPKQLGLVRGLWQRMYAFAIVDDASDKALDAFCRRMTCSPLGACTAASCRRLIECMKKMMLGRNIDPAHVAMLETMLIGPEDVVRQ